MKRVLSLVLAVSFLTSSVVAMEIPGTDITFEVVKEGIAFWNPSENASFEYSFNGNFKINDIIMFLENQSVLLTESQQKTFSEKLLTALVQKHYAEGLNLVKPSYTGMVKTFVKDLVATIFSVAQNNPVKFYVPTVLFTVAGAFAGYKLAQYKKYKRPATVATIGLTTTTTALVTAALVAKILNK